MERLFVDDKSGDRKYFTMIPNIVIDCLKATEKALYLDMKRIAGEEGVCWAGTRELARRLGTGREAVRRALASLLRRRWVEFIGERNLNTSGGRQPVKCYRILDIWRENLEHFEGGSIGAHPGGKVGMKRTGGGSIGAQGGSIQGHTKSLKKIYKEDALNFEKPATKEEAKEFIEKLRGGLK